MEYDEHEKRAWSVDFSKADPTKLASGSDDGTVKLWSINQVHIRQSLFCTICHTPGNEPSDHKVKDLALSGFNCFTRSVQLHTVAPTISLLFDHVIHDVLVN